MLILHNLAPMHWALAGGCIAAITLTLLFVANRRLGVSSGFEDVCSLVLPTAYFRRPALLSARGWRLPLVGGLALGGALSAIAGGGWTPTWDAGALNDLTGFGPLGLSLWMFTGGLLVGFGTRMANGCTSGHGIFGLSNFEWPSLVATLSFMAAGIMAAHLLYRVIFS